MSRQILENRVERLESKVEALEQLPDRMSAVESQIVQLRGEMHDGFSALRGDMLTLNAETIQHAETLNERTNRRMEDLHGQALEHAERLNQQTIAVVEMLHAGTNNRLDGINTRLGETNTRLDGTNSRLDGINSRVDGINSRLEETNHRLDETNRRMEENHLRIVEQIAETRRHTSVLFEEVISRIARIGEGRPTKERRDDS